MKDTLNVHRIDDKTLSEDRFRAMMSTFPSGVAVITTVDQHGSPIGMTCSAVCSVSLRPPLLLVCIKNQSSTLSAIKHRGIFAINLLHEGGREAADLFSSPIPDRFRHLAWVPTARRALPSLTAHAHTVAECAVRDSRVAGDHTVIFGEVILISAITQTAPLVHGLHQYIAWNSEGQVVAPSTSRDGPDGIVPSREAGWL